MLSTASLSIQFGAKPLFEQVSVKFDNGNRYGLIGANGCGKSTLMKILGGELEPSAGDVMLQAGMRLGKLNQNQFGYEDERVLDVVMQGHQEMWQAMTERDRIYADANATDDDYMRAAELEGKFAEYGGYDAEARAGAILTDAGLDAALHNGPMREVAPGLKLRVLLAQALFSKPDVLLLDEPTNNSTSILSAGSRHTNDYDATMTSSAPTAFPESGVPQSRIWISHVKIHRAIRRFHARPVQRGSESSVERQARDRLACRSRALFRRSLRCAQATSRRKQLEKTRSGNPALLRRILNPVDRRRSMLRLDGGKLHSSIRHDPKAAQPQFTATAASASRSSVPMSSARPRHACRRRTTPPRKVHWARTRSRAKCRRIRGVNERRC